MGLSVENRELVVTTVTHALPDLRESSPEPSIWPFVSALAVGATFIGSIFTPWAVVRGALPIGAALVGWFWPKGDKAALAMEGVHWLQHVLTALHIGMLDVLLTFAPLVLYPGQSAAAHDFGLTPNEDQQLAGLVMWVPGGVLCALAGLGLAAVWIGRSSGRGTGVVRAA